MHGKQRIFKKNNQIRRYIALSMMLWVKTQDEEPMLLLSSHDLLVRKKWHVMISFNLVEKGTCEEFRGKKLINKKGGRAKPSMSISIKRRSKVNWRVKWPSSYCSMSKVLCSNNLPITVTSFSFWISFTFSSVLWNWPIWLRIMSCKTWVLRIDPCVHKSNHNVFSSPIKATSCWPNPSWKP